MAYLGLIWRYPSTGEYHVIWELVMKVWEMPAADRELLPELPVTSRGINELGAAKIVQGVGAGGELGE